MKKQLRAMSAVLNFAAQRLAAIDEEPISASGMLRSIAKAARRAETRAAEDKHYTRKDLVAIFSSDTGGQKNIGIFKKLDNLFLWFPPKNLNRICYP